MSYGKIVAEFKKGAAEARAKLQKQYRGKYVAAREVEVLEVNEGGRIGAGEPLDFLQLSKMTGKRVAMLAAGADPQATKIALSLGFDLWESFGEYIQTMGSGPSFDYEPRIHHYEVDIPLAR